MTDEYFVEELGEIVTKKITESYDEYIKKNGIQPKYLILSESGYDIVKASCRSLNCQHYSGESPNRYMGMIIAIIKNAIEGTYWVEVA